MESRMTRALPDGSFLVPQLLDRVVREYAPNGDVRWEFRTPGDPKDAWPFTAIRLPDGHTLVTCTHGNMVVEVDATGAIVWKVSNADFDRPLLNDPCGAQRLPNGNTVICSYAIGAGGTKLVEVDRAKHVTWTFAEPDGPGIHEVHVLETDGRPVPGAPLR
jgi:outer membrane protein assembly factor BamB